MHKMKYYISSIIFIIVISSIFTSCISNDIEKKMEAQVPATLKVGDELYTELKNEHYESIGGSFSKRFYKTYTGDQLTIMFSDIRNKYGSVRKFDFIGTKLTTSIENGEKQHLISNSYKVLYATGFVSKERLTFVVDDNTKTIDKVDGYSFSKYSDEE